MKTATAPLPPLRSVKVLDQLRERIRCPCKHQPNRLYVHWVRAFIVSTVCVTRRQPWALEVEAFLSRLANERKVSVSTHRQALAALLFFYGKVLTYWVARLGSRKTSAVAALAGGADLDEVVRILGFLEGEHRFVRPASTNLWNGHADQ